MPSYRNRPVKGFGGGKKKGIGGHRRTAQVACGHIFRGAKHTLQTQIKLHKKCCESCSTQNLSWIWATEQGHQNLTDLSGGCNYGVDGKSTTSVAYVVNSTTGQMEERQVESSAGNITATLNAERHRDDFETCLPCVEKVKETKTQKKRRMKKNKKERKYNASIGLGEKTIYELNPFEIDFMIKKQVEQKYPTL